MKFKNNKSKYIAIVIIVICILITVTSFVWIILSSNDEFTLTILNTSNKIFPIEVFLYRGSGEDSMVMYPNHLDSYGNCTFHFNIDKSYHINKILIEAINNTWSQNWYNDPGNNTIKQVDAYAYYYFSTDKIYDLIIVINSSGTNMTILKMPEQKNITRVNFT